MHQSKLQLIKQSMSAGKLHHAYLFNGIKGIGKASVAMEIAHMLLGSSASARALIKSGAHPDLRILRAEEGEMIKIDEVRRIIDFLHMTAAMSARKVVIIDAIDNLNARGANALLKSLEEPSKNTHFFLICHSIGSTLGTIRSRCFMLNFLPPSRDEFSNFMASKGLPYDSALYEITGGSIGLALEILQNESAMEMYRGMNSMNDSMSSMLEFARKETDNDLIELCSKLILAKIVERAKEAALSGKEVDEYLASYQKLLELEKERKTFNLDSGLSSLLMARLLATSH